MLISPPAAVLLIAPANVLQGAVLEHGFTSSPTPDTQVRVACARRAVVPRVHIATAPTTNMCSRTLPYVIPLLSAATVEDLMFATGNPQYKTATFDERLPYAAI